MSPTKTANALVAASLLVRVKLPVVAPKAKAHVPVTSTGTCSWAVRVLSFAVRQKLVVSRASA